MAQKRIRSQKLATFSFTVKGDIRMITWVKETESVAGKVCLIKPSGEIFKNAMCYGIGKYQDVAYIKDELHATGTEEFKVRGSSYRSRKSNMYVAQEISMHLYNVHHGFKRYGNILSSFT
jgi:hypothetical protein